MSPLTLLEVIAAEAAWSCRRGCLGLWGGLGLGSQEPMGRKSLGLGSNMKSELGRFGSSFTTAGAFAAGMNGLSL